VELEGSKRRQGSISSTFYVRAAFTLADPKSTKNTAKLSVFLALLGCVLKSCL